MTSSTDRRDALRMRSVVTAAWFTLHALAGCALLSVALGDFVNGDRNTGDFRAAGLGQVLAQYAIPMPPGPFFVLMFIALTLTVYAAAWLWRRWLRARNAEVLDEVTWSALRWSLRQQMFSGWLLLGAGLTTVSLLAVGRGPVWLVGAWVLGWLVLPLLILRPCWLHASSGDRRWLPSGVALALYSISMLAWTALTGAVGLLDTGWTELLLLPLDMMLMALQASVLIHVGSRSDIVPHLVSRWNGRFWLALGLAAVRPWRFAVLWVLPPALLLTGYNMFVAPTVQALSPFFPAWGISWHQWAVSTGEWWTSYWWVVTIAVAFTWLNLYLGRCIVLFDEQERRP
jgi:hypothetical protein